MLAPDKLTAKQWQQLITEQVAPGIKTTVEGKKLWLHVASYSPPLSEQQPGNIIFSMTNSTLPSHSIPYHGYVSPETQSPFLTPSRPFNLMFKTFLDPIDPVERIIQTTQQHDPTQQENQSQTIREKVDEVLRPSTVYLRPETAQGVFINFEQVTRTMKMKVPFGIAQVGKSFRNEIRLEHGIFRTPEFEQMELEYFVSPWTSGYWYDHWRKLRYNWWLTYACHPDDFRQRDHQANEMAHYAVGCTDVEFKYPWGWGEVEGVAHRGNYDLTQHMKTTRAKFEVIEDLPRIEDEDATVDMSMVPKESRAKYIPHVIESSCGLNRAMLAFLCDAFHQIPAAEDDKNGQPRNVLKLHPQLAPVKCAVMPLTGKPEFLALAQKVAQSIRKRGLYTVIESQKLRIGKRYYRHDEIGTPWCITVDYQSLDDGSITIRERDSGEQHRLPWQDVQQYIDNKLLE
ncbi:unnamed protein product [Absidia cylindrospora]